MTAPPTLLVINAAELMRQPGSRRHITGAVTRDEVGLDDHRLAGGIAVEVTLESTLDDVEVTGHLSAPWNDECRRCLRPLSGTIEVEVDERYAERPDAADDAFPIVNGQIDLAPMVREEVLLSIPDAPLCRPDCPGLCPLCGVDLQQGPCGCDTTVRDERWAVLDQLRTED